MAGFSTFESSEHAAVVSRLRASGSVFAEDEADVLIGEATDPGELARMVEQRIAGVPIQYIVGWAEFYGLRLVVAPGVFVPRSRSEFLASKSVELAQAYEEPIVVDLCCGVGAIAAAVAAAVPGADLYASDIDPTAVESAARNLPHSAHVFRGDVFEGLPSGLRRRIDVIAVNAPYVPTDEIRLMPPEARLHEAHVALDGGGDGLDVQRRVARDASSWLRDGGHLLIETSEHQAPETLAIVGSGGMEARLATSEEFDATVVIGRR